MIGYSFQDSELQSQALTHASVADARVRSNERLEFLGDAVLGMVVCHELYRRFDGWLEGDLTKVKSAVVSRRVCARVADDIGLTELLSLGNGIDRVKALPLSVRAAVYESIIGAIYIDGGLEPTREFILKSLSSYIDKCAQSAHQDNFKSELQQFAQRTMLATPQYITLDEQGPDHSKCFEVCVTVNDRRFPSAWGASKKAAEQDAARRALDILLDESRAADDAGI